MGNSWRCCRWRLNVPFLARHGINQVTAHPLAAALFGINATAVSTNLWSADPISINAHVTQLFSQYFALTLGTIGTGKERTLASFMRASVLNRRSQGRQVQAATCSQPTLRSAPMTLPEN
jgi:hypothetical protein